MPTFLISGASRGIGLELTRLLVARGDAVLAVCRRSTGELAELGARVLEGVDVTRAGDLDALVEKLGDARTRDLAGRKIAVGIVHPGMVATEMTGHQGIPAAESARGLIARIDALDAARSGRFFHQNGEELPW